MSTAIEARFDKKTGEGHVDGERVIWLEKLDRGKFCICRPGNKTDIIYCSQGAAINSVFYRFESLAMWMLKQKAGL